jgi:hypothetical protein
MAFDGKLLPAYKDSDDTAHANPRLDCEVPAWRRRCYIYAISERLSNPRASCGRQISSQKSMKVATLRGASRLDGRIA